MDRVCIFLNGVRGAAVAEAVAAAGHTIRWMIAPQACAGELTPLADRLGAELLMPVDVNDAGFVARYRTLGPALAVVAGFSAILKRPLMDVPEHGTINLHAGALPRYRGGSPLNWQMINGEREAGISVIRLDEGIDSGPILAEARIPIGPDETIGALHERAIAMFCRLAPQVMQAMENGALIERAQDETQACYWLQRNAEDGRIDWPRMSARQVHDLVRAVTRPYPGAIARFGESEWRIFATRLDIPKVCGVPGRVAWLQGRGPYVVCADRAVLVTDYEGAGSLAHLRHGMILDGTR